MMLLCGIFGKKEIAALLVPHTFLPGLYYFTVLVDYSFVERL